MYPWYEYLSHDAFASYCVEALISSGLTAEAAQKEFDNNWNSINLFSEEGLVSNSRTGAYISRRAAVLRRLESRGIL